MTTTPAPARPQTWAGEEAVRTLTFLDINPPADTREPVHVTARCLVNDTHPIRVTDGWAVSGSMRDGTIATLTVHPGDVDLSEFDPPHGFTVRLAGLRCLVPKDTHPERILLGEPTFVYGEAGQLLTDETGNSPDQITEWVRLSLFVAVAIVR